MEIKFENNIKSINGRGLSEILDGLSEADSEYAILNELYEKTNTEKDFIESLREIRKESTPVYILSIIKSFCGYKISEANEILEEVLAE